LVCNRKESIKYILGIERSENFEKAFIEMKRLFSEKRSSKKAELIAVQINAESRKTEEERICDILMPFFSLSLRCWHPEIIQNPN
jgi:hypothetical protein